MVEGEGIGGHAVGRGDGAKRADEIVGPGVAHDADGLDRQKHGEGLPDGVVEAVVADFVEVDGVGAAQDFDLFRRHLAGDPDRQPRPRERVAADHLVGQAEFAAELADLVLEQLAQGARPVAASSAPAGRRRCGGILSSRWARR